MRKVKGSLTRMCFVFSLPRLHLNMYVHVHESWYLILHKVDKLLAAYYYAGRPIWGVPLLVTALGKQHPDSHTLHCGRDQARSLCSHVHLLHVYLTPHKQCMWTGVGWMGYKPKFYHISLCMLERYCITCMLVFLFSSYPTPLQVSPCWGSYNWRAWGEWHDHDTLMEAKGLSSYHGCMVMGFT